MKLTISNENIIDDRSIVKQVFVTNTLFCHDPTWCKNIPINSGGHFVRNQGVIVARSNYIVADIHWIRKATIKIMTGIVYTSQSVFRNIGCHYGYK